MKTASLLLLFALTVGRLLGAEVNLPASITLKSGTILRNISVVRWSDKNTVVIKSSSGVAPWRLDYMTDESRAAMEAYRDAPIEPISGEIFVALGGGEVRKLGAVLVSLYQTYDEAAVTNALAEMKAAMIPVLNSKGEEELGASSKRFARYDAAWLSVAGGARPAAVTTHTNSDGKFTITPPSRGSYVLVVVSDRMGGRTVERYLWIVHSEDIKDPKSITLGNHNLLDVPRWY